VSLKLSEPILDLNFGADYDHPDAISGGGILLLFGINYILLIDYLGEV
jgi:hypothetical protein